MRKMKFHGSIKNKLPLFPIESNMLNTKEIKIKKNFKKQKKDFNQL